MRKHLPRLLFGAAALIFGLGGLAHGAAYFSSAEAKLLGSGLAPFFRAELQVLWLGDATTLIAMALVIGSIALKPGAAGRGLILLLALVPGATALLLYWFLGGFYAAHLLALGAACMVAGALLLSGEGSRRTGAPGQAALLVLIAALGLNFGVAGRTRADAPSPHAAAPVAIPAAADLARRYLAAVDQRRFSEVASLLTPDFAFESAGAPVISGPDNYVRALRRIAPILRHNDIKRVWADGDEACVVYDFVTDTQQGAIPSVEWITVRDGRIASIQLIFHSQPWPAVLQELARRNQAQPDGVQP
jgi:ketosteroid isomerase-like protein